MRAPTDKENIERAMALLSTMADSLYFCRVAGLSAGGPKQTLLEIYALERGCRLAPDWKCGAGFETAHERGWIKSVVAIPSADLLVTDNMFAYAKDFVESMKRWKKKKLELSFITLKGWHELQKHSSNIAVPAGTNTDEQLQAAWETFRKIATGGIFKIVLGPTGPSVEGTEFGGRDLALALAYLFEHDLIAKSPLANSTTYRYRDEV